jgi:hypothetical protein
LEIAVVSPCRNGANSQFAGSFCLERGEIPIILIAAILAVFQEMPRWWRATNGAGSKSPFVALAG